MGPPRDSYADLVMARMYLMPGNSASGCVSYSSGDEFDAFLRIASRN